MVDGHEQEDGLRPPAHRVRTNASSTGSALSRIRTARDAGFGQLSELVHSISNQDAASRYQIEEADNRIPTDLLPEPDSAPDTSGERTVISWEEDDRENPYNWPKVRCPRPRPRAIVQLSDIDDCFQWRKVIITITSMTTVINSTMGSALPSMSIPFIAEEWGVTSHLQMVLPMSTYLIGYVFGPIVWGPISEQLGRRNLTAATFILYMIWTMACALAPNWPALLVFRLFCGVFASAPIAVVTGIFADIYNDPVKRGRAMAYFMVTTLGGPLFAPIVSGFCGSTIGWRWTFWVGLIFAGATFIPILFLPETYGPILLTKRAAKIRKENPKAEVYSAFELEDHDFTTVVTKVLTRPIRMLLTELIVTATCLYLALVYAIFYMSFEAFPIIFQDVYHLSPGVTGLCYLPIGGGALLTLPVFFGYDNFLRHARTTGKPWTKREEFRRVPLATLGGPLFVISLFWLGWSARSDVSFVVPMLAGVPFGAGFMLIFMGMLNYLTDAYEIFAASANAAASSVRSVFAVVLPLATTPMFKQLGINGACSLLAGLSLVMSVIPFLFLWKGETIREGSKFCIALKQQKMEMEQRAEEQRRKRQAQHGTAGKKEETV
ncbi:major facilitator superfamily transporter [Xylariomycetidae sp. FL0641]|nr:major facilitator superfamily transporter [Xylariomycetidae sp. FL0641]